MQRTLLLSALILTMIVASTAQTTIDLDTDASVLKWRGSKLFGFGEHYGTIDFDLGQVILNDEKLIGGTFIIDMTTMVNTDGEYSQNLIDHLSNQDFFDVEKYPTSTLVMTKVEFYPPEQPLAPLKEMRITADLTIKGITKDVNFYAELNDNNTELKTRLVIDRTRWGITYGAKSVTNVQDHIISDALEFDVNLVFKSQI